MLLPGSIPAEICKCAQGAAPQLRVINSLQMSRGQWKAAGSLPTLGGFWKFKVFILLVRVKFFMNINFENLY